jgi:hypothetical protein
MRLVKHKCLLLLSFIFSVTVVRAQEFTGYVKKFDTAAIAAFQAKVEITENNQPVTVIKTYFDGSYKFTPGKSRTYTLHITYPGYTDTTFTITSDKKGIPTPAAVTTVLKKDGMRLLGIIKSKEDDFPIKGATISVKNIMTRKEERVTTGIDGYYNVKLEYETNYRVSIDKRSEGIINRFKDTAFYISTVGFNQPLDYRLDIALEPATDTLTPYSDYKPVPSKATKPVIEVKAEKDSATGSKKEITLPESTPVVIKHDSTDELESAAKLKAELEKVKKELAEIKLQNLQNITIESATDTKSRKQKRKKKQYVDYTEVVVIRDTVTESPQPEKGKKARKNKKKQSGMN